MSWWIWAIIIAVVILVIGFFLGQEEENTAPSKKSNSQASRKTTATAKANKSAREIANEVETVAQFRALERKLDRADEKRQEAIAQSYDKRSLKAEEKTEEKYQLLQEAYDIASKKVLRWQFIPNIDLHTPLLSAKNAYKTFSLSDYKEKLAELGNNKDEWYGLRGDEEPDEKEEELKFIIKFRTIIENDELTEEERNKKINSLVTRSKEEAANFFDTGGNKSPADQWLEEIS